MKKFLIGFVFIALVVVGFLFIRNHTYAITITQQELQQKLSASFPMEKTYMGLLSVKLSNPQLTLQNDTNRVQFQSDISTNVSWNGQSVNGTAQLSSSLRYDPTLAQFFLDDFKVEKITGVGLSDDKAAKLKEAAGPLVQEYLKRYPIYTIEGTDLKMRAAKLLLKDVKVNSQAVHVIMGL